MSAAGISIVIPTFNGAGTLPALLDALWSQRTATPLEIIAVDSGSTDGSVDLLRSRVQQIINITPEQFDHGLTRNLGMERASGEFVVLIVQDALPTSEGWLEALTAPLRADPTIAGTFARQLPSPGASALTRHYLARWAASSDTAWTSRIEDRAHYETMTPVERLLFCTFDNVCSCIRRSVWAQQPFRATPIAEDLEWARDVLLAGHALAFVPSAEVHHSHERSARYEFQRTRILHDRLHALFGLRTIPTRSALARAILSSLGVHLRCEWRAPARWPRACALAFAWPLGQYLGARDAVGGGTRRLPPGQV